MKRCAVLLVLLSAVTQPLLAMAQEALARDIRDIRGPLSLPPALWDRYESLILATVAGLVAALSTWALARLLHRGPDPRVQALAHIERALAAAEEAGTHAFVDELGEALRGYVEQRFGVHAPRRTTEELLEELAADPRSPLARWRGPLAELLAQMDLVKFGGVALPEEEIGPLAERARRLVEESSRGRRR
jgi:hypothetical protein